MCTQVAHQQFAQTAVMYPKLVIYGYMTVVCEDSGHKWLKNVNMTLVCADCSMYACYGSTLPLSGI